MTQVNTSNESSERNKSNESGASAACNAGTACNAGSAGIACNAGKSGSADNPNSSWIVAALDIGGTKIAGALVCYDTKQGSDQACEQGVSPEASSVTSRAASRVTPHAASRVTPRVVNYLSIPTQAHHGGEHVFTRACGLVSELVAQTKLHPHAIGVSAAGVVNPSDGSIAYANNLMPGWTGIQLAQRMQHAHGIPCFSLGDVHAHALGEVRFGCAQGFSSALMVAIGTGLGGAYIVDGHIVTGAHGAAGHLGHSLHHLAAQTVCSCGGVGHAESVTSGTAICARYQGKQIGDPLDETCMGAEISKRAAHGEPHAQDVLRFCGNALGQAIGSWCNLFDPEAVVISGSVVRAGDLWKQALEQGFSQQVMPPLRSTKLLFGTLESHAPLLGAAEYARDRLLCPHDQHV